MEGGCGGLACGCEAGGVVVPGSGCIGGGAPVGCALVAGAADLGTLGTAVVIGADAAGFVAGGGAGAATGGGNVCAGADGVAGFAAGAGACCCI